MPAVPMRMRIPGLTRADGLELAEYVDPGAVRVEAAPLVGGDHGDLGLVTAIVLLSIPALKGFIAYLSMRHQGKSFEQTVEFEHPDGTVERRVLKIRDTSGDQVNADLAKELASMTDFPVAELLKGAV